MQLDPAGDQHKLVPLLIGPADLKPLARQIVYKSLVGLSRDEAISAILDAVGHSGSIKLPTQPWPGSSALKTMTRATRGVFDVELDKENRLQPKVMKVNEAKETPYGFSLAEIYSDMRQGIANFEAYVCNRRSGKTNFRFSSTLEQSAQSLFEAIPEDLGRCSFLSINRALVTALHALENDDKEGLLPTNDMIRHHWNELRGFYQRLEQIYPKLKKYREQHSLDRFTIPNADVKQALANLLETAASDQKVVAPSLSSELRSTESALSEAENMSPGAIVEQKRRDIFEPHKSTAAVIIPIWDWLANASEKFAKSGRAVKDVSETVESYRKLYKALSTGKEYIEWLSSWFF